MNRVSWGFLIVLSLCLCHVAAAQQTAQRQPNGLRLMDKEKYRSYLRPEAYRAYRSAPLPESFDWAAQGMVTPPKDQAICGSCWAFAATSAFESHILIAGGDEYDLSEQMMVSCNSVPRNFGCYGGYLDGVLYYRDEFPREEVEYPYLDDDFFIVQTEAPPFSGAACHFDKPPVCYNVNDFYTINVENPDQLKRSIMDDGPAVVGYFVFDDFYTYWNSPLGTEPWTDGVYFRTSEEFLGGHAVLAYGWENENNAILLKNSWGATEGPFGDGTFKIRPDHFVEASNFTIEPGECEGYRVRLKKTSVDVTHMSDLCPNNDAMISITAKIRTSKKDRIEGGSWHVGLEYPMNGFFDYIPQPVPNGDFITYIRRPDKFEARQCVDWYGEEYLDVEYWFVDQAGVASNVRTERIYNYGG